MSYAPINTHSDVEFEIAKTMMQLREVPISAEKRSGNASREDDSQIVSVVLANLAQSSNQSSSSLIPGTVTQLIQYSNSEETTDLDLVESSSTEVESEEASATDVGDEESDVDVNSIEINQKKFTKFAEELISKVQYFNPNKTSSNPEDFDKEMRSTLEKSKPFIEKHGGFGKLKGKNKSTLLGAVARKPLSRTYDYLVNKKEVDPLRRGTSDQEVVKSAFERVISNYSRGHRDTRKDMLMSTVRRIRKERNPQRKILAGKMLLKLKKRDEKNFCSNELFKELGVKLKTRSPGNH